MELFGPTVADISSERRISNFRYKSPAHRVDVFRAYYGPTHKAFAALDDAGQKRLQTGIVELLEHLNVGGANSLVVPGEYLQVIIVKQ